MFTRAHRVRLVTAETQHGQRWPCRGFGRANFWRHVFPARRM